MIIPSITVRDCFKKLILEANPFHLNFIFKWLLSLHQALNSNILAGLLVWMPRRSGGRVIFLQLTHQWIQFMKEAPLRDFKVPVTTRADGPIKINLRTPSCLPTSCLSQCKAANQCTCSHMLHWNDRKATSSMIYAHKYHIAARL